MSESAISEAPTQITTRSEAANAGAVISQPPAAVARHGDILPPKKKKRRVLPLVVLAALGAGGYEGYRWFVEGRFLVATDDAYVKADMSTIAAKVAGYVATVPIVQNTRVSKGDVLATIDDGDYRNAVDSAQAKIETQRATIDRIGRQVAAQGAMIDQAKASLASAKADAQRTATEYDRARTLMQSTYGTQQRLDQALADRDRAAAAVASATASVTSAEANLDVLKAQQVEARQVEAELGTSLAMAERNLSFTTIRAPFDGVVGNKAVQAGQYVQTGTRLLALVPLKSAYVEANFKETQIDRLQPGQKVTIKPDAFSSRAIEGSVESIAPASGAEFSLLPPENATGNFTKIVQRVPVRIRIPSEVADEGFLRPGLSVEVEVHTRDESLPKPSLVSALGLDAFASNLTKLAGR
ncbi:HlyD family secretion protein [Lichenifustis flavocetrariae]|uniref:HlyD family secretion protein n=1 Tax=Lichenifustis flavocetrariae TaxID=2949735 RepID=A0AA42CKT6_9HYPH|nr:HlyD family secretion protein [Lichenifustis flavocetrariae]MCW6510893.1 HlyD family secretion protein [Lichenifustis flavocetrariae]